MNCLEIKNISYSYQTLEAETMALQDISFTVGEGEFVSIVGPSGCGKSTLLNLICGLAKADTGEILLNGSKIDRTSTHIGYMLQKDHLFEWRSVYSNVTLGLELRHSLHEPEKEKVRNMLDTYGLSGFSKSRPSQLSGGMRQRAALIRTLAVEPDILLLDEPFSALDYQTRLEVCDDVWKILKDQKKTALLVTHDLSEAISMSDKIIILSKRPGHIKSILEIHFEEGLTPLKRRNAVEFPSYFNTIWEELMDHGR
ncbi:MAG TPA: ABC transporter ATP-binding protein [Candidatus Fimimorpha excrementavium]|nr:ABC transporter ATP-binding protein [Candidatus Fimimorpha excrementavium]